MKWNKNYLINGVRGMLIVALLVSVIGFAERNPEGDVCREVIVSIENRAENYFLDEADIMNLITDNGLNRVAGVSFSSLNLKDM